MILKSRALSLQAPKQLKQARHSDVSQRSPGPGPAAPAHRLSQAFDLVISDLAMPQMAGDRLAQALLGIRSDIPVILCTGYSDRVDEGEARAIGVKAFVFKPIMVKEKANTVRRVLDEKVICHFRVSF